MNTSPFFSLVAGLSLALVSIQSLLSVEPPAANFQIFSDTLLPGNGRNAGAELKGAEMTEGGVQWLAAKGVTFTAEGVTASSPNGGHHMIRPVSGVIQVSADINAKGSGFSGIALGRGDLSGNFWNTLSMIFYVQGNGFNLMVGSKTLIDKPDKSLVKSDAPNHLEMTVDTMARTVTAKINGTTVLNAVPLPETAKLAGINSSGFRFNEPLTAGLPTITNYHAEVTSKAAAGLEPADVSMCFVDPDTESTLTWNVESPGPTSQIPYVIRDYLGGQIAEGKATLSAENKAVITRTFPNGYFEIVFTEAGQTFGIVSTVKPSPQADPFFCMDAGLTWLEMNESHREGLIKAMSRSGIALVRERLGIGNFHNAVGKYNWNGGMKFESIRRVYADNNLPLLEIMDDGGKHLGAPKNLSEMAVSFGDIGEHWPIWKAIEGNNEPDIQGVPADHYVPLIKVMSYAMTRRNIDIPVISGALATMPPSPYFDTCEANGMLEDSDGLSYHSYDHPPDVEAMVGRYRTWLKKCGKDALPLWNTECGWAWKQGTDRPSQENDAVSAMEIAAKAMESKACGVTAYFPFVLVYYIEGTKNFGMMGREATPLRSMAAYVACIRALGNKAYLGDLQGMDASVKLARVFEGSTSRECVAVLYTGKVNPSATVPFQGKVLRVTGADGRNLPLTEGKLPIPDGLAYVWMERPDPGTKLKTDTSAMGLYKLGQNPLKQKRRASPLILDFMADQTPSRPSSRRYLVTQELAKNFPLYVKVYNLSDKDIGFTPELNVPGKPPQKSSPIVVPAMGSSDLSWTFDASSDLDIAQARFISVTGQADGVPQPLPVAIPVVMEGNLEQHLKRHTKQLPLPITELARWSPNIGNGTSTFSAPDGIWRMEAKFTNSATSWTYPKFKLPEDLNIDSYSGFLLRARIKEKAKTIAIIAGSGEGIPSFWIPDLFPADGEWHVVYIPFAEFKPGPGGPGNQNTRLTPKLWQNVGLGFGNCSENTFEISHLVVVGGSGE